MNSLSWTPVLSPGKRIYCSPACGYRCTRKAYLEAKKLGTDTLKLLKHPEGWKVRVWENGGWHVQLQKGGFNLHIRKYMMGEVIYSSLLGREIGDSGGNPDWSDNFHHKDPNVVIEHQLKLARRVMAKMNKNIDLFKEW